MVHKKFALGMSLFVALLVFGGAGCIDVGGGAGAETTGPAGMYVSTDRGETWKQISAVPTLEGVKNATAASVYNIFEDPQDPKAMYWASRNAGLFFTYDDGKTWQQPDEILNAGFVYSVAVHPEDKCTVFATNGRFIYKSTDCNRTWTEVYRESRSNVGVVSLDIHPFPPYQLYAAETNGDILQSVDFGGSWRVIKRFKARISRLDVDQFQEGVIYVAGKTEGLVRSDDSGETWTVLNKKLEKFPRSLEYRRMILHPSQAGSLFWVSTYGILRSDDSGKTWEPLPLISAPGSVDIYAFAVNPNDDNQMYYVATFNNRSTLYRTIDGGQNWITQKLPSGQIPTVLRTHPDHEDWLYAGFTIPPSK